jgi:hypothetical protein
MTTEQLRQKMGADATEAEARAMGELLWERYSIDVAPLDPEEPLKQWIYSRGHPLPLSDSEFFGLVPDAIARAAGAAPTKKLTLANYEALLNHLFDRIHKAGEEIKNDFPNILRFAIEREAWKEFVRADGTRFENLVEWLEYQWPNGPSMGQGEHAITYEDALQLTEGAPEVHRILAENPPPTSKGGRPPKNREITRVSTPTFRRGGKLGKSATVLEIRLAKEKPGLLSRPCVPSDGGRCYSAPTQRSPGLPQAAKLTASDRFFWACSAATWRDWRSRLVKIFMRRDCNTEVSRRGALDRGCQVADWAQSAQGQGRAQRCPCLGGFFPGDNDQ